MNLVLSDKLFQIGYSLHQRAKSDKAVPLQKRSIVDIILYPFAVWSLKLSARLATYYSNSAWKDPVEAMSFRAYSMAMASYRKHGKSMKPILLGPKLPETDELEQAMNSYRTAGLDFLLLMHYHLKPGSYSQPGLDPKAKMYAEYERYGFDLFFDLDDEFMDEWDHSVRQKFIEARKADPNVEWDDDDLLMEKAGVKDRPPRYSDLLKRAKDDPGAFAVDTEAVKRFLSGEDL